MVKTLTCSHLSYFLILLESAVWIYTSVRQEHSLQTSVLFSIPRLSAELTLALCLFLSLIILFSRENDIMMWEVLAKVLPFWICEDDISPFSFTKHYSTLLWMWSAFVISHVYTVWSCKWVWGSLLGSFPCLNVEVAYHISDLTKGNITEILRVWVKRVKLMHRVLDLKWMASWLPLIAPGAPPVSFLRLTIFKKKPITWRPEKCVNVFNRQMYSLIV